MPDYDAENEKEFLHAKATRMWRARACCPPFLFSNICLLVVCEILKSHNKTTPKYTALQEFIIDSFTLSKEFN